MRSSKQQNKVQNLLAPHKVQDQGEEEQLQIVQLSFRKFPNNFQQLFAFLHNFCQCHRRRLTCAKIFQHENVDFDRWLGDMLDTKINERIGNKKKLKLTAVRRTNQLPTERMVQKMQGLIKYRELASTSTEQAAASQPQPALDWRGIAYNFCRSKP